MTLEESCEGGDQVQFARCRNQPCRVPLVYVYAASLRDLDVGMIYSLHVECSRAAPGYIMLG